MELGERIKNLRKENELTQEEFANAMNVSPAAVTMWETGRRTPAMNTIREIADFFNCNVDYLLGRIDSCSGSCSGSSSCYSTAQSEFSGSSQCVYEKPNYDYIFKLCNDIFVEGETIIEVWKDDDLRQRLLAYAQKLLELKDMENI